MSTRSEFGYRLLLFLIVVAFFWKLVFNHQYDWIAGPDLTQQVLPWFEEQARQIQHGHIPLWDPHSWGGQPLLGQAQPGTAYPLNWLLWLIPRQHGHIVKWALQWYFVMIHYMAALFCYLLCRDLGRSRAASMIAGVVFALAGYIGRTDWPQMLNGAVWAPLVIMFILRAARGFRPLASAAFAGLCLGLSWLSGHHEAPIYLTLAAAAIWLYDIFKSGRPDWRIAGLAALAAIVTLLVGALQILPAQEYGRLALRWAPNSLSWNEIVPYSEDRNYALYASSLLGVIFPGMNRNEDPFIGVVALGLAILGIALGWKERFVKVFAVLGIGGLVYTLAHQSVFHGIIYALVPWAEKARVPSRALFIFQVAAAILAAYGVDYFVSGKELWVRRFVSGLTGLGLLGLMILFGVIAANKLQWNGDDRIILTPFIALLFAGLLYAWHTRNLSNRAAQVLLVLLVIQEVSNNRANLFHDRAEPDRSLQASTGNADIANFLHSVPGFFRADSAVDDVIGNWGDYYDVDMQHSYLAGATANVLLHHESWQAAMLNGVRYTIAPKPAHDGQINVFWGQSGMKVYENPQAFPRAWAVHEIVSIQQPAEGKAFIDAHLDELRRKALMMAASPPKLEACEGPDNVLVTEHKASNVVIHAEMSCDGMVVLSDTFYPGWYVRVDGKPAEIYEINLAMRGVVAPKGTHELVFRYRPWSVIGGALLSMTGVLAVFTLALVDRRRQAEAQAPV